MTHVDLFSGIGGFALASQWAGFRTIQFVEIDPFCQKVLAKNFPGVPIHADVTTFDGKPFRGGVDLLTGGFPCQPFSIAGKQRGKGDDRFLWPAMFHVISDCRPTWIIGENVDGIVNMELDSAVASLESIGYAVWTPEIPACAVDAWHKRNRVWIIAHDDGARCCEDAPVGVFATSRGQYAFDDLDGCNAAPDADSMGVCAERLRADSDLLSHRVGNGSPQKQGGELVIHRPNPDDFSQRGERGCPQTVCGQPRISQFEDFGGTTGMRERSLVFEPKLCRSLHGIPFGVDRLRALGNSVVPQVAYAIINAIAELLETNQ